jgi:HEAT repeat protein
MLPEWEAAEAAQKARRHPWCATGDTVERGLVAADILAALADTGDRLLAPLFVERLCSPDSQIRQTAIRVCGEWKIAEAAPILRRLACVGAPDVRRSAHVALENKESHR